MGVSETTPLDPKWRRAFSWIERRLGGKIVRQGRWRPAWFIDLERDGETLPICFRGDRGRTDETLIRAFHRRVLRQEATLKPAMRELEHSRVQLLE